MKSSKPTPQIKARKSKAVVFSYDIFDTAIVRALHSPDHIHWLVGRVLKNAQLITLDSDNWRLERLSAEREARRSVDSEEVSLLDIYCILKQRGVFSNSQAGHAMAIEITAEKSVACPVDTVLRACHDANINGASVIFISDMYLDKNTVFKILGLCGYKPDYGNLYVSSDIGKTKRLGTLFSHVISERNLSHYALCHTGDNRRSDIRSAQKMRISTSLFEETINNKYEQILFRAGRPGFVASAISGSAKATRLSRRTSRIGVVATGVAGPIITAFVLSTLLDAQSRGIQRLYFLARDGQILIRVARQLIDWAGLAIECQYLMASRQAFYLPSLSMDLPDAVDVALRSSQGKTTTAFFSELEFAPFEVSQLQLALGKGKENEITDINAYDANDILAALDCADLSAALTKRIAARRTTFLKYAEQEGLSDHGSKAIVDLGWHGNLQVRLERALSQDRHFTIHGYYYDLVKTPEQLADRITTFAAGTITHGELLETFCMANHSTICSYQDSPSGYIGEGYDVPNDDGILWGVNEQQDLIDAFCRRLLLSFEITIFSPQEVLVELRQSALASFRAFVTTPTREDADAYGSVRHASAQGHTEADEIAPRISTGKLISALISGSARRKLTTWPHGMLARSTPLLSSIAQLVLRCRDTVILVLRKLAHNKNST